MIVIDRFLFVVVVGGRRYGAYRTRAMAEARLAQVRASMKGQTP